MKKLFLILILFTNFSCTKWYTIEPDLTLEITDCEGRKLTGQYVEFEDVEGTNRATSDKNGRIKIDEFSGSKIFVCVPSKNFCKTFQVVENKIVVQIC